MATRRYSALTRRRFLVQATMPLKPNQKPYTIEFKVLIGALAGHPYKAVEAFICNRLTDYVFCGVLTTVAPGVFRGEAYKKDREYGVTIWVKEIDL